MLYKKHSVNPSLVFFTLFTQIDTHIHLHNATLRRLLLSRNIMCYCGATQITCKFKVTEALKLRYQCRRPHLRLPAPRIQTLLVISFHILPFEPAHADAQRIAPRSQEVLRMPRRQIHAIARKGSQTSWKSARIPSWEVARFPFKIRD